MRLQVFEKFAAYSVVLGALALVAHVGHAGKTKTTSAQQIWRFDLMRERST